MSRLRLRTLGGLAVEGDPAPDKGAATQRRPLALLALVASAGERGVSRDKLLAYLWPESTAGNARHLLTQALYSLRRDLRADDLFLGSNALRLNPAVMTSDAGDFQAALAHNDLTDAVTLYKGPFLDGFFLSRAPEFEHWVDTERQRLANDANRAVEALAAAAAARGDHHAACEAWRQLTVLEPLNSRYALGLMRALAAGGDRAGALRHAEAHTQVSKQELDAAPDPAIGALVEELRAQTAGAAAAVPAGRSFTSALAGRYAIERELGRGGTTTVYLARDLKHDRPVVLKVLHPELTSAVAAKRFLRQIRLVARLRHPHILPLYDSGEAGGFFFYVAPYIDGGSLRARLERESRLPVKEALELGRDVAEALDYAHRHDVLHRNVKPENVLLDGPDAVVAGFGIVRALHVAREQHLTAEGLRMGTPAYMSPEQAMCARDIDGRSDIYNLACVVFEMLTGAPPFGRGGPDTDAVIARRFAEPPPSVLGLRPDVPAVAAEALAQALAPRPADRVRTAAAFARALRNS